MAGVLSSVGQEFCFPSHCAFTGFGFRVASYPVRAGDARGQGVELAAYSQPLLRLGASLNNWQMSR
jgi:hypothetical protein